MTNMLKQQVKDVRVLTIIVSYNFMPWVDRCLPSLRASTLPTDVMVIDNASADDTVQHIRTHYPWVRLVASDRNLGFGLGNNIGMEVALREGYDAVFLMNEDAWLATDDALEQLVRVWLQSECHNVGIWSPVHMAGNGKMLDFGFSNYTGLKRVEELPATASVQVPFVNAAFWLLPAETLRRVGGFSRLFFLYGEDVDYVNRVKHKGLTIRYVPASKACHDREQRVETPATIMRAERVWHLSEYGNPNHSLPCAFAYGVLAALKKSLHSLDHLRLAFWLLWRTPQVLRHRCSTHSLIVD